MQARGIRILVGAWLLVGSLGAPSHAAQITTEYGIDFVTVGDPGNTPAPPEFNLMPWDTPLGQVDYTYRIARTELSVGQWIEFVQAIAPFLPASEAHNSALMGRGIGYVAGSYFFTRPTDEPTTASWLNEARFANWLHNGKISEAWAFESGAYDLTQFDDNGDLIYPITHEAGAQFWIPSVDEWVKAAHFDPSRHGEGQPGFWAYPYSSDEPPIWGLPEDGGQTNAGNGPNGNSPLPWLPVGSYPDAQTPWGMLDASGSASEWTETTWGAGDPEIRDFRSSARGDTLPLEIDDRVDAFGPGSVLLSRHGIRIAANIPGPSTPVILLLFCSSQRRRRVT